MKKTLRALAALALAALLSMPTLASAYTKREMRSTWLATVWAIDWPSTTGTSSSVITKQKNELTDYLDQMVATNMTSICFQVRSMCDAMYPSSYEPWSSYLTGSRGTNPGWDPLAFCVEECHKRGIECYAWVNPYRYSTGSTWTTSQDKALENGGYILTYGSTKILNPGLEYCRQRIVNVCEEIITNYAVDGILFDDYFYPNGIPESSSAEDYSLWKNSGTSLSFGNWRRANVNQMVKDVYDMIQEKRPDVRFGIAPAGGAGADYASYPGMPKPGTWSDWQYSGIYSAPLAWMNAGTVDFISPQLYWSCDHSTNPFGPMCSWWSQAAELFNRHFYASHSLSEIASSSSPATVIADRVQQVGYNRQYTPNNAPGSIFYSQKNFNSSMRAALLADYFSKPALTPVITWKTADSYSAPASGSHSGTSLSWSAVTNPTRSNAIIRYSVYAVPTTIDLDNAKGADGDGISVDYLLGVSYATSYTLDSSKKSGYWYAVCVLDGYGNESEPLLIDYPSYSETTAATLISPANGESLTDEVAFSWSNAGADTYDLQISASSSFSTIKYSLNTSSTTALVGGGYLGVGTWYWRVVANKSGYKSATSASRKFTLTSISVGSYEPGYSIITDGCDYSSATAFTIKNDWIRSTDSSFGNFSTESNGVLNRTFVAVGDYLYLSGRTENASSATCYLGKYDRYTGEHISDIILGSAASIGYYPCNTVLRDEAGHVMIANLTLDISSTPLVIQAVDLETGELTTLASLTYSGGGRVDHAAVYGDISSSSYYIFAMVASSNTLLRCKVANGTAGTVNAYTLATPYNSAANVGIAPLVIPVSASQVLVNGQSIALTRYKVSNGSIVGSFNDADSSVKPSSATGNGGSFFNVGEQYFMVYPSDTANDGHHFTLVTTDSDYSFASMANPVTLPGCGLGSVNSTTAIAQTDYVVNSDGTSASVYVYAPGNGFSAYTLSTSTSGVNNAIQAIVDSTAPVEYYNLQGMRVAQPTPGNIYIRRQGSQVTKIIY